MMIFSGKYIKDLHKAILISGPSVSAPPLYGINNTNPYRILVEATLKEDMNIEIPTILRSRFSKLSGSKLDELLSRKCRIVTPVFLNSKENTALGNSSLIRALFDSFSLSKVSCKDQVYYGCRGIILDRCMNMLLMVNSCYVLKDRRLAPTRKIVVHVSPTLFLLDRPGILEKHIIKRVIPAFLSELADYGYLSQVEVKIDNAEEFIKTIPPPQGEDINESLNNLLENNIDDLLALE
jgi:hypothetical protein|nr:MAG TPA: hypothetical protein [Crassvirales sp.]